MSDVEMKIEAEDFTDELHDEALDGVGARAICGGVCCGGAFSG